MKRRRFFFLSGATFAACAWPPGELRAHDARASYDVIVYGGTPGGITSAIAAAREGANTLLIEPTRHVGGMSVSGLNTAETEHMLRWTFGGLAQEFYQRLGDYYGTGRPAYSFESHLAERTYVAMLKEAGVAVRFGGHVQRVHKDGARLLGITLTTGDRVGAKVFIDASYEGDLLARAAVKYAVGREATSQYEEEAAGVRFDKDTTSSRTIDANGRLLPGITAWATDYEEGQAHPGVMCYNFRLTATTDARYRVPIPAPKRYDPARYTILRTWLLAEGAQPRFSIRKIIDFYPRRNSKFELNNRQAAVVSLGHFGGQFRWPDATYSQRDRIFRDHREYTLGLLHFLRHDEATPKAAREEAREVGLHKDEFADNEHFPYQLYVREARRMEGALVMTQRDVQLDRRKKDAVAIGSHFIDSHHVQRLAVSPNQFVNEGRIWRMGHAYQIPYRALLPEREQACNLLVPVAASFSHVAFGAYRVESTWMMAGHAAGLAGALAARSGGQTHEVDVALLQSTLAEQGQVIEFAAGQPEKCPHLNGPPEF
jgi:hypothetical protein